MRDHDRYLMERGGWWYYVRRVPSEHRHVDGRGTIRVALKTRDKGVARTMRDHREAADDGLWAAGRAPDQDERYSRALAQASAMRLAYRTAGELAREATLAEILSRLEALQPHGGANAPSVVHEAVLGGVEPPDPTMDEALNLLRDVIDAPRLAEMSESQRRMWERVKRRSVKNFVDVTGCRTITAITRDHALTFHSWLTDRVAGKDGEKRGRDFGVRQLGDVRSLHAAVMRHYRLPDTKPFDGLRIRAKKGKSGVPIPVDVLRTRYLAGDGLLDMGIARRQALLVMIETGARPSEILAARPEAWVLDHAVPHLRIEATGRALKNESSVRLIPLVGAALAAMRHRGGAPFAEYADKAHHYSNAVNKYLRAHDLLPDGCALYSIRHSVEARHKAAGTDEELRRRILGHALQRQAYGWDGGDGDLALLHPVMAAIALPFEQRVIEHGA